ncbi:flagellar biosynthesis protein FlgH [Anoxybacter fermentans]|uniref:Flagellar biosynthesis protein FlgH n=1 Tax=Anoxybacter fermentans TaxID=1323375 RepID=A0A3Q9HRB3_9FIRM|nr:flagellar basal body L-ring protein FlgH [Anoxybacter fermentans]AZR73848.1 flagellar biosynthesis protein FlgH [Anoxybacter fermentans]
MKRVIIYALLFCLLLPISVSATSLWDDKAADIYKDKVASEIGDLVTIIIVEKSSASQKASTETSQDSSLGAGPGLGIFDFIKTFSLKYSDKNEADGVTVRQGLLNAQITARVIDKQPNGNLVVRGLKTININGESQEIEITGVIRQRDIKADNTIESIYMSDVEIRYTGEGVVGDKQKSGIFEKIFNWLF